MANIVRSKAADEDLLAIAAYGSGKWGIEAALTFVNAFNDAFALLARYPDIGRPRDELGNGVRSWLHRGYIIYYVRIGDDVVIGRILHGAADPAVRFDPREYR